MGKVKPVNREHRTREIKRAAKFLVSQMKKGWSAEESLIQVETQYGFFIKESLVYHLNNVFNKREVYGL